MLTGDNETGDTMKEQSKHVELLFASNEKQYGGGQTKIAHLKQKKSQCSTKYTSTTTT